MSDTNLAADQLKAFVRRIESVEDEITALNNDKSEIYKEAKSGGFDVKQLRKVVQKRRLPADERQEQDAVFDLYWDAIHGAENSSAHARVENIEEFPVKSAVQALRSDPTMAIVDVANLSRKGRDSETGEVLPSANDVRGILNSEQQVAPQPASDLAQPQGQVATIQLETANETPVTGNERLDDLASVQDGLEMSSDGAAAVQVSVNMNADGRGVTSGESAAPVSETDKSVEAPASAAPALKYAEPGVITWETFPPEGVERGAISAAFGWAGQDSAVIADDLEKGRAQPIVMKGNVILDGWARYIAARDMRNLDGSPLAYPVVQYDGNDLLVDIIKLNVDGRILTEDQKRKIAANLARQEPSRKDDIYKAFELWMEPV